MEKGQREIQSQQTRARIIAEATGLFVRKGYGSTSIADLSEAVGVTKGALYHHFENKEAIFYAVIDDIRRTWRDVVAREVVGSRDALERLERLFDQQARFLQKNESFCLVLNGLMTEREGVDPSLVEAVQEVYAELTRFIEAIIVKGQASMKIRADINARLTALTIVGMLRGTGCSRPLSERMEADYAAVMETLRKVMIRGLQPA
jgi:TetR/AcrR family transcriptional regulator, transcriptional repressor for nem operon